MLKLGECFAGVTPRNKGLATNGKSLDYISSSNLVVYNDTETPQVYHFDHKLNCIAASGPIVVLGDVAGNATVLFKDSGARNTSNLGSNIISCCIMNDIYAVFCTFNIIFVFNVKDFSTNSLKIDSIVASVSSIDGKLLVGTNLGFLQLYEANTDGILLLREISAHLDTIRDIHIAGDNIVTASQDTNVRVWKCTENDIVLIQTLNGHSDWVNSVCSDGDKIYSASADKTVRTWELNEKGYYICSDITGVTSELLTVVVVDGKLFIQTKSGGIDTVGDGVCRYFTSGHLGEVTDLDWKGNLLISCSLDRTTRLFYMQKECARAQIHGFPMTTVKFLPGSKLGFISAGQETILRTFEATQTFFATCEEIKDTSNFEETIDFAIDYPDSTSYVKSAFLAELNLTNEVGNEINPGPLSDSLLSSNVFKECKKIYGHYFEIKNIAVGKDLILSCNRSALKKFAGLFVWSCDCEKLEYIEEHGLDIQRIAISPDNQYVVTVGRDHLVCLMSINKRKLTVVGHFVTHKRIVWDCGFSRDSKYFASCSRDGNVVFYETESRTILKTANFGCEITSVTFSPSNDILAIATCHGEVLLLDYELTVLESVKVASQKINVARFDPTGSKIAIGGCDGLIRMVRYN